MTEKIRSSSKKSSPINLVRGAVGDKKNFKLLRLALALAKAQGHPDEFQALYGLGRLGVQFSNAFNAGKASADLARLSATAPLPHASLERELLWAGTACSCLADLINHFVSRRNSSFRLLMSGDCAGALKLLDEIDEECGTSLWSIENRITFLSMDGGFERQKSFVSRIAREHRRTFVAFFAAQISERNETRVLKRIFESRLNEKSKNWKIEEDRRIYINYKLMNKLDPLATNLAIVLSQEGASGFIDLYETLLTVLRVGFTGKVISAEIALRTLSLIQEVEDPQIKKFSFLFSDGEQGQLEEMRSLDADRKRYLEHFLAGDYEKSAVLVKKTIEAQADDLAAITTKGKLGAMGYVVQPPESASPLYETIAYHYSRLFGGGPDAELSIDQLETIALNLHHAQFSDALLAPVKLRTIDGCEERRNIQFNSTIRSSLVEAKGILCVAPEHGSLDGELLKLLSWRYEKLINGASVEDTGEGFSSDSFNFAQMLGAFGQGRFEDAKRHAECLVQSPHEFFRSEGQLFGALALFKDGDIVRALEQSIRLYVTKAGTLHFLPILEIIRHRGYRHLKELRASPALSIAFSVYMSTTLDAHKDVAAKVAWKEFLKIHGVNLPSGLEGKIDQFNREEILFFLRKVCVQDVMELGESFQSPIDLDQERIRICQLMSKIDPANNKDYDNEIVDLTRRILIEEGVGFLESSRIYVDEMGVLRWIKTNLEDLFLRYREYIDAGLTQSVEELGAEIDRLVLRGTQKELVDYLDNYDVTADTLLEEFVEKAAWAFLLLPRSGLDAFLSARVRHGSLVGYLRGPLESRNLVTKRNITLGTYEKNSHWARRLNVSDETEEIIQTALVKFSSTTDKLLDEAIARIVHVNSDARPDGVLRMSFGNLPRPALFRRMVVIIKTAALSDTSLDEVARFCIEKLFWPSIMQSLEELQVYVKRDVGSRIRAALDDAWTTCASYAAEGNVRDLIREMNVARELLENAAERVSKWFNSPQKLEFNSTFRLEMAIEIGLQSVKNARPHFHPNAKINVDQSANVILTSAAFGLINDVSFLILENIFKHSGFEDHEDHANRNPTVGISVSMTDSGSVEMLVDSDISLRKELSEIDVEVQKAKAIIARGDFEHIQQATRGTGLVRLAELTIGGDERYQVDFGVVPERKFRVKVVLPIEFLTGLSKEDLNECHQENIAH